MLSCFSQLKEKTGWGINVLNSWNLPFFECTFLSSFPDLRNLLPLILTLVYQKWIIIHTLGPNLPVLMQTCLLLFYEDTQSIYARHPHTENTLLPYVGVMTMLHPDRNFQRLHWWVQAWLAGWLTAVFLSTRSCKKTKQKNSGSSNNPMPGIAFSEPAFALPNLQAQAVRDY